MNRLLLLPFALPFGCLALLSLLAFLSVLAIAGAIRAVGTIKLVLGIAGRRDRDPWHGMMGEAHPLDFIEGQR
jgi:hypothetical protein